MGFGRESKTTGGLTDRHRRVLDHYFENGCQSMYAAMRACGFSESTSKRAQYTVFGRPEVTAEIERRHEMLRKKTEINNEWVLERLAAIADAGRALARYKKVDESGALYWDFTEATPEDLALINDLTVEEYAEGRGAGKRDVKKTKIGVTEPKSALDSIARILGMFQDRVRVEDERSVVERLRAGRGRVKAVR